MRVLSANSPRLRLLLRDAALGVQSEHLRSVLALHGHVRAGVRAVIHAFQPIETLGVRPGSLFVLVPLLDQQLVAEAAGCVNGRL